MSIDEIKFIIAINSIKWLLPYAHEYLKTTDEYVNAQKVLNQIRKFVEENELNYKRGEK